ncbi:MAG TPA: NAD-dependent epimerase/dehydratase family protein [Anaerolineae bacterium]|nr:NAD-dependent epimerase/dehydratase family protein [Anaerolineae bacterium]
MPGKLSQGLDPAGHSFLVTGGAGFIGSHIVRWLVANGAQVRVLDLLAPRQWNNLATILDRIELFEGNICDMDTVRQAVTGVQYVLHLAALTSVPESVAHPEHNLASNVIGTHNILVAAREAAVRRVVFSSSCAVYGDQASPHHEGLAPRALSPYAAAKLSGEQLCRSFTHVYGLPTVCLRYFNVFGPGQNPFGSYAAVIPQFIMMLLRGQRPVIYGDGRQARDFVYVDDVVKANLLACSAEAVVGGEFNVGTGQETSILDLLTALKDGLQVKSRPIFAPARVGDIVRSYGDISRARTLLGYRPSVGLAEGLRETFQWYREQGARFWVQAKENAPQAFSPRPSLAY